MASCEKKDLGAQVSSEVVRAERLPRVGVRPVAAGQRDQRRDSSVGFWMGVARVGRYVAQVNFTPTGDNDVDEDTFQALITRARDRLFELPASTPVSGFELADGLVYLNGNSLGAAARAAWPSGCRTSYAGSGARG